MTAERTWEIKVWEGGKWKPLTVTLAQYRAYLDERAAMAKPIMDAFRRGDIEACGAAQVAMRKRFA